MRGETPQALSGKHAEGFPFSHSVALKSVPIEGEDIADSRLFGQGYEGRVREIHGYVPVLYHQNLAPLKRHPSHWNENGGGADKHFQTGLLTPRPLSKQMHCLCEYRLRAQQETVERLDGLYALLMMPVIASEHCDQRVSTKQDLICDHGSEPEGILGVAPPSRAARRTHSQSNHGFWRTVGHPP